MLVTASIHDDRGQVAALEIVGDSLQKRRNKIGHRMTSQARGPPVRLLHHRHAPSKSGVCQSSTASAFPTTVATDTGGGPAAAGCASEWPKDCHGARQDEMCQCAFPAPPRDDRAIELCITHTACCASCDQDCTTQTLFEQSEAARWPDIRRHVLINAPFS